MFDKHFHSYIRQDHSREAARILGSKLEAISQADIESKNRVDITLAEYERLKKAAHDYKELCDRYCSLLTKIGIPCELIDAIDPSTVSVVSCADHLGFKSHYQVCFSVYELPVHK